MAIVFPGNRALPDGYLERCNFPNFEFPEVRIFSVAEYSKIWPDAAQSLADLKRVLDGGSRMANGELPYVPFVDAHPAFTERVVAVPLENGRGIAFLTQWMIEPDAIGGRLVYIFEGLSADGRSYVLGTFPVKFLGELPPFSVPREERIEQTQVRYEPYAARVAGILRDAKDANFSPNLQGVLTLLRNMRVK